ncbi:ankyrin repeat domain-containing protein [Salidesulfovibrio brasiliensis]|uniref:ankyrin repeat domain-containing protein n=1 Tax=Salidesulfovibrio brasiliensis TaxID=221711 RepID=UPI0006D139AA|nr:ankyrin repeat domain-containing protein [Salidesulfovibrio brasiliensis]
MKVSTFYDLMQDKLQEATLKKWRNGKVIPPRSSLMKIVEQDLNLGSKEAKLKKSFLVCMQIACTTSRFIRHVERSLGTKAKDSFVRDFLRAYQHFIRTYYSACETSIQASGHDTTGLGSSRSLTCQCINEITNARRQSDSIGAELIQGRPPKKQPNLDGFEEITSHYNAALQVLPPTNPDTVMAAHHIEYLERAPEWGSFKTFSIPFLKGLNHIGMLDIKQAHECFWEAYTHARFNACHLTEGYTETALSSACFLYSKQAGSGKPRGDLWLRIKQMISWSEWHGMCHKFRDVAYDDGTEIGHDLDDKEYQRRIIEKGRRFFEQRFAKWIQDSQDDSILINENLACGNMSRSTSSRPFKGHMNTLYKDTIRDNSQLMEAIVNRDYERILQLIENGADLNFRNTTEDNAFYYAMDQDLWSEKIEIAEAILKREADPILPETLETPSRRWRTTAMRLILTNRNPHLLELLLMRGVNVNRQFPFDDSHIYPLCYAVLACAPIGQRPWPKFPGDTYGSDEDAIEAVTILIEAGADVNATNRNGITPLSLAVQMDNIEIAQQLIAAGANCDRVLDDGTFILELCSSAQMRKMLEKGIMMVSVHLSSCSNKPITPINATLGYNAN